MSSRARRHSLRRIALRILSYSADEPQKLH